MHYEIGRNRPGRHHTYRYQKGYIDQTAPQNLCTHQNLHLTNSPNLLPSPNIPAHPASHIMRTSPQPSSPAPSSQHPLANISSLPFALSQPYRPTHQPSQPSKRRNTRARNTTDTGQRHIGSGRRRVRERFVGTVAPDRRFVVLSRGLFAVASLPLRRLSAS